MEVKKSLNCVTTRRRKLWVLNGLSCGLQSLAAHFLVLCALGSDVGVLATFTLPPRREPVADFAQAFRVLAVALVVTPRLVFAFAPFAQADPRARAAPSGLRTPFSLTLAGAHGRFDLPREKLGEDVSSSSSGIIKNVDKTIACKSIGFRRPKQKREQNACSPLYRLAANKTKNETALEMRLRGRRADQGRLQWRSRAAQEWRQRIARCQADGRCSAKTAAELLNVNVSTIADWCQSGTLDGIKSAPYAPWWIKLTPEIIAGLRKPTRRTWSRKSVSSEK